MTDTISNPLPRWRGFNLQYFCHDKSDCVPVEDDFRWIADLGFDFIRLPTMYTLWVDDDPFTVKEDVLGRIDETVALGDKYGLHTCLNFHTAPGYRCSRGWKDPFGLDLWKDARALEAFCFHWQLFANRYKGTPSEKLSFNLVNEPPRPSGDGMTRTDHERVIRTAVGSIRSIDSERLILADEVDELNGTMPELADLGIAQACRGYVPGSVSHYGATWGRSRDDPEPTWPSTLKNGDYWDRTRLTEYYEPWAALIRQGVGVFCGECGCFNKTPHGVFLAWFEDVMQILKAHGIGYALWNFRGSFGILDSARTDVEYEDWHGHGLDRALLDLLQRH